MVTFERIVLMKLFAVISVLLILSPPLHASGEINDDNWVNHPKVKKIRKIYNEINNKEKADKLSIKSVDCELYGGAVQMYAAIYSDGSIIRKYVIDGGSEDSTARAEYYYDTAGVPRFTYRRRGAVNGTIKERRIYFDKSGNHLYTNLKEKGPGYNNSNLSDSVNDPISDIKHVCKE